LEEVLIVKNFGPIKDVTLNLKRFNVLIGEQATGKSTIAKLLAVCRYYSYIVPSSFGFDLLPNDFDDGLSSWGINNYLSSKTHIEYKCHLYHVVITGQEYNISLNDTDSNNGELNIDKRITTKIHFDWMSQDFKRIFEDGKSLYKEGNIFDSASLRISNSFYQNDVASVMDNPYYIYPERSLQSIFSLGKNSIPNLSDSLFSFFGKTSSIVSSYKNETSITPLDLSYKNNNGIGFIKNKYQSEFIKLSESASGYQSAIPIVLIMKYYVEIRRRSKTFIIEEPEISLFPETQKKLLSYIVELTLSNQNSTLITTHSPYILTSLNNLILANKVGINHKQGVEKIIDKKSWIDSKDISCYLLCYDDTKGGIIEEDIKDSEGFIKVNKIDEISRKLNEEFNLLMSLDLNIPDEQN
jgi:AAA15 family ATPase/GTPase